MASFTSRATSLSMVAGSASGFAERTSASIFSFSFSSFCSWAQA